MPAPLTIRSDRSSAMPAAPADRVEPIAEALASLRAEERRLARLGVEPALTRCREELRYWRFLEALHALAPSAAPRGRA